MTFHRYELQRCDEETGAWLAHDWFFFMDRAARRAAWMTQRISVDVRRWRIVDTRSEKVVLEMQKADYYCWNPEPNEHLKKAAREHARLSREG